MLILDDYIVLMFRKLLFIQHIVVQHLLYSNNFLVPYDLKN